VLGLAVPPWRLEGFDVSNLMGTHTVASLVVFEGGRAKKSEYRRLRIHGLDKPDDFTSMHQAVYRRFTGRLADQLAPPDLLLIDGGKGQLSAAQRALIEAGVDVPLVGWPSGSRRSSPRTAARCCSQRPPGAQAAHPRARRGAPDGGGLQPASAAARR
jgi:excinuclease UvrABC nuclease subunit